MLPDDFAVVIPSRGRSRSIGRHSLTLFPYATVTVDERELEAYAGVVPEEQLLPHPPMNGLLEIENWIHEQDLAEFVYLVADDIRAVRCNVGYRVREYRDPFVVADLLETTAYCARDAGAFLFGAGHHLTNTYYTADRPFTVVGYVRNVYGYRRGHELRGDPAVRMHYDVDIALQALLKHRIIWRDERFAFIEAHVLGAASGGNAGLVDPKAVEDTNRNMRRKWGRWVAVDLRQRRIAGKTNYMSKVTATSIRVNRRYAV